METPEGKAYGFEARGSKYEVRILGSNEGVIFYNLWRDGKPTNPEPTRSRTNESESDLIERLQRILRR